MSLSILVQQLREGGVGELEAAARLPDHTVYTFDQETPPDTAAGCAWNVLKTTRRQVVSLRFSRFQSHEVIRLERGPQRAVVHPSPQLTDLVPRGGRYAYDLIAYVGQESFLHGRKLQDIAVELVSLGIPFSSLYDVQQKFLFYLGHLHRQSAPRIREYLQQRGAVTWLIDGTQELGSPVFFGVKEAQDDLLLGCWKISSENVDEAAPCLAELKEAYGLPERVLHDLSDAMSGACDRALEGVKHHVCQFHLLRDIGQDLYQTPQLALSKLLRQLKLQARMKEQRSGQLQWLREHRDQTQGELVLRDLLEGKPVAGPWPELLGREVLLALHQWILDYARDGRRQGFPFDPYLLYLHRRVVRAAAGLERLQEQSAARKMPMALSNLARMLNAYLTNPQVAAAAAHFEAAWTVFQRLRDVLRFSAQGTTPLRDSYRLTTSEQRRMISSLQDLREECRQRSLDEADPLQQRLNATVCAHLDRYWECLPNGEEDFRERTTNGLERHWGQSKRVRRRTHGRRKLTRDFQALPEESMLVPNLDNPRYQELVLGTPENLADRLAAAGRTAGPYSAWQKRRNQSSLGRLPKRLLRKENSLDHLLGYYDDWQQQGELKAAG